MVQTYNLYNKLSYNYSCFLYCQGSDIYNKQIKHLYSLITEIIVLFIRDKL